MIRATTYLMIKIPAIRFLLNFVFDNILLFVTDMLYLNAIAQMNGDTRMSVSAVAVICPHIPLIWLMQ